MDRDELLRKLQGNEWTDLELKAAKNEVPKDVWETVSSFSNTNGGYIVFGIADNGGGSYEIQGVENVDKVQNDFLTTLRGNKFNMQLSSVGSIIEIDGITVLVFKINPMPRQCKPIFYGGDIRNSFIRLGSGDHRCSSDEINRMLREASELSSDAMLLNGFGIQDIDIETLNIYRRYLVAHSTEHPFIALDDTSFLKKIGAIANDRTTNKEELTMAGLLLFGKEDSIRERFPAYELDFYLINGVNWVSNDDKRWDDRKIFEKNLIRTFIEAMDLLKSKVDIPFDISEDKITRTGEVEVVVTLREALANMLMHRDYFDNGQSSIKFYNDRIEMSNPGSAPKSIEEIIEDEVTAPRNPSIAKAFRLIGWSEIAGSGMAKIVNSWSKLGLEKPVIDNDITRHHFKLTLPRVRGKVKFDKAHLKENELLVINYIKENGSISNIEARKHLGLERKAAVKAFNSLMEKSIIEKSGSGNITHYVLADK